MENYYIRRTDKGKESIYGMRYRSASLGGYIEGYKSLDKAKAGCRYMRKQDIDVDNYERESYAVVDRGGNVLWELKQKA
jgi:hypothetical protein